MNTIEIKRQKGLIVLFLLLLAAGALPMIYLNFFTKGSNEFFPGKLIVVVIAIIIAYNIYTSVKTLRANKPAIILSQHVLELNEKGKTTEYLWNDIEKIYVDDEDSSYYLVIHAHGKKKKFSLSYLEKEPSEIESLIENYTNPPNVIKA